MKLIVVDIGHEHVEDLYVSGENYLSDRVKTDWQNNITNFDYASQVLDDLIGLSECCGDTFAHNEAIKQILYGDFGLRAIKLLSKCSVLSDSGRINQDLALINRKLCELGIGYISEKTYLVDSLAQYRLLIRDYMDHILTIRMSRQIWNFINLYLSDSLDFYFDLEEQSIERLMMDSEGDFEEDSESESDEEAESEVDPEEINNNEAEEESSTDDNHSDVSETSDQFETECVVEITEYN